MPHYFTPSDIRRFWAKVDRNGPIPPHRPELGPCWLWTGGLTTPGYGRYYLAGSCRGAHIASFCIHDGELHEGQYVCHHCDNPACVNPRHLFGGDPIDNVRDMHEKGRAVPPPRHGKGARGEQSGRVKLTAAQAQDIRERYIPGLRGADFRNEANRGNGLELAAEYGVSRQTIWQIATGRSRRFD